jgi:hypothetical protein
VKSRMTATDSAEQKSLGNSCSNRGKQTKIFTGITGKLPIFE